MSTESVLEEIQAERGRQEKKWGPQDHPDVCPILMGRNGGVSPQRIAEDLGIPTAERAKAICESAAKRKALHWGAIIVEELAEAVEEAALGNRQALREELVQCGAVICAWIEAIDRRKP